MSRKRKTERRQRRGAAHPNTIRHVNTSGEPIDPMEARGYKNEKLIARSPNQKNYMRAVRTNDVVLCHGPPGCGKTHIAAGMAVHMMRAKEIEKIVMARPVVPTGRDIGYLPGDVADKLGPYLAPLFDELGCYCEKSLLKIWMDTGKLEIVPLAMMRGRTFKNAFVILDEAQNATIPELKMFFTRFGMNSKVVVTGDLKQSDLRKHEQGGFQLTTRILSGLNGLEIVELDRADIVRHGLTGEIDARFNRSEECLQKA